MTEAKKYFEELNIFRALLIIWVVIGHSFDLGEDILGMLHSYAYTFHMAGFFMLSGFLFAKKSISAKGIKEKAVLIGDRTIRLLVPYFFFTAVSYVLKLFFGEYANNQLGSGLDTFKDILLGVNNPNGGLWFLHSLFIFSAVAVILNFIPGIAFPIVALGANTVLIIAFNKSYSMLYYIFFFFLGIAIYQYYPKISGFLGKRTSNKKSCALLFLITALLIAVSAVIFNIKSFRLSSNIFIKTAYALLNIISWYLLSFGISKTIKLKKPLSTVGSYGMDIYMLGYYVQIILRVVLNSMLGTPYIFYSFCMMIFGLLLPIPISKYIVRKIKPLSLLCLGDYKWIKNNNKNK